MQTCYCFPIPRKCRSRIDQDQSEAYQDRNEDICLSGYWRPSIPIYSVYFLDHFHHRYFFHQQNHINSNEEVVLVQGSNILMIECIEDDDAVKDSYCFDEDSENDIAFEMKELEASENAPMLNDGPSITMEDSMPVEPMIHVENSTVRPNVILDSMPTATSISCNVERRKELDEYNRFLVEISLTLF